ncbi:MAG TPA: sialidase [Vicinamibacteria bacterium]|nr:sialidase [Vicinamibacteria bacterium]
MKVGVRVLSTWIGLVAAAWASAQSVQPGVYERLQYRYIGPVGNRLIAVAGLPGNPNVYYAGAASGGIFKTTDAGATWAALFDEQPASSIGSLAIAPSDANVVWAGTGETFIRSNISIGNGIYKSTDAGETWTHMGLEKTGRIGRIVIDPRNPEIVLACALGHAYGPQPERGVFRTEDGGKSWEKVLFVDENTGCSDVAMDPANPRILYAGMWQVEIHTYGRTSGGPGSGLFRSKDGGVSWTRLEGHGLPSRPVGKVSVAVAPSRSRRVYALIETGDGVPDEGRETESGQLWRSDDAGDNWRLVSHDRQLRGRTHYYTRHVVEPDDENEVYFLSAYVTKTLDGGETILDLNQDKTPGGDSHDMWIDPTNGDRMIVAHDDGISISVNRGDSWLRLQLPVAQMYHVAVDDQIPYFVYGNRQDGPSTRGPSHSRLAPAYLNESQPGPIPRGMWRSVGGSESGWAIPDLVDPDIIWASGTGYGSIGGAVDRFDLRTQQARRVEVWPDATIGWPAADLKFRFNWTFPLVISPHDHETLYVGSQFVHRTTNGGQSWDVISPDLTLNDKERQQISGGLTPDNIGVEYAGVVFAIAESPLERGLIWAGTNDGQVQVTRNGGQSWTNVTEAIRGLPSWGTVSNIEPSRYDAGTAYITVDLHQMNNRDPFVYKTEDYGKIWKSLGTNVPKSVFSYAHCVREDPVRKGMLYLGTENGVYLSLDDGGGWLPLQSGLPHAPAHWLVVQERFNDLVVATYGRGFWILDDVTPLRQLTEQVLASSEHLFTPRAAYRFRFVSEPMTAWNDATIGHNPPEGALIHYFLKSAPEGDVKISVVDGSGQTIRTFDGTKHAGINRVRWDLRNEQTSEIRLRTAPPHAPEVRVGREGFRPFPLGGRLAVLAPPGTYTVKLKVAESELSESLTVLKDPNTAGSESDIGEQTELMKSIQNDLEQVAGAINTIERVREQLHSLTSLLEDREDAESIRTAATELEDKLVGVEEELFQMKVTGRGQDQLRWPAQLVQKLVYLADGVSLADFAPTKEQREVEEEMRGRFATLRGRLDELVARDVAAFNDMMREKSIPNVIVRR